MTFGLKDVDQVVRFEVKSALFMNGHRLSEKEKRVIILRYGLENGKKATLQMCANEFGISKERIRQIEAKAIRKIREPAFSSQWPNSVIDSYRDY